MEVQSYGNRVHYAYSDRAAFEAWHDPIAAAQLAAFHKTGVSAINQRNLEKYQQELAAYNSRQANGSARFRAGAFAHGMTQQRDGTIGGFRGPFSFLDDMTEEVLFGKYQRFGGGDRGSLAMQSTIAAHEGGHVVVTGLTAFVALPEAAVSLTSFASFYRSMKTIDGALVLSREAQAQVELARSAWSVRQFGGGPSLRTGGAFPKGSGRAGTVVQRSPIGPANESFDSYADFLARFGPASQTYNRGMTWEHIVEQSMAGRLGAKRIYSTENTIPLPREINKAKADIYSRLVPGTNVTAREWLSTQSFEQQYQFEIDTLRSFGVTIAP